MNFFCQCAAKTLCFASSFCFSRLSSSASARLACGAGLSVVCTDGSSTRGFFALRLECDPPLDKTCVRGWL